MPSGAPLSRLFRPAAVAVVGASPRLDHIGGRPLRFLIEKGYGGRLYPVNARGGEIAGMRCYPRIEDLPEAPDVALVMVRASLVPDVIEACAQRGTAFAVVFAAGFSEASAVGTALESRVREIADRTGIRVVGPNCYGCLNAVDGVPLGFAAPLGLETYPKGPVGLFSQSGAFGFSFFTAAAEDGVGFSYLLNTGNSVDVGLADFLEFATEDPSTALIAGYVEGIPDGRRFARAAGACLAAGKPVVLLKVGGVAVSERAVRSHTGALSGSRTAFEAAAERLGVLTVRDPEDLLDVVKALAARHVGRGGWSLGRRGRTAAPPPTTRPRPGVAVITTTGASGILFAEAADGLGLELPDPRRETLARLREVLPPYVTPANPVDTTAAVLDRPRMIGQALTALGDAAEFDGAAVLLSMPGPELARPFFEGIRDGAALFGRPVVAAVAAGAGYTAEFRALMSSGPVPLFPSPRRAAAALQVILYVEGLSTGPGAFWAPEDNEPAELPGYLPPSGPCGEAAAKRFFSERGLVIPRGLVATTEEAARRAVQELGLPLVAKTAAREVLHKSAAGLVRLGIREEVGALAAFEAVRTSARSAGLGVGADGVLLEEDRGGGAEVFLGARLDPTFGLLIGLGVGGAAVEARSAVRWELAPLGPDRVAALVENARARGLLKRSDGRPGDLDALASAVVAFYQAVRSLGNRLVEAEINPLAIFADGEGVCALDAVLELAAPPSLRGRGAGEPRPSS